MAEQRRPPRKVKRGYVTDVLVETGKWPPLLAEALHDGERVYMLGLRDGHVVGSTQFQYLNATWAVLGEVDIYAAPTDALRSPVGEMQVRVADIVWVARQEIGEEDPESAG